jgi:hypothetical protein
VTAVGELTPEYEGRVDFVLISAEETAGRQDEIIEYGFVDQKHGLVGFTSERVALVKMPGHNFGKPEIQEAANTLLAVEAD